MEKYSEKLSAASYVDFQSAFSMDNFLMPNIFLDTRKPARNLRALFNSRKYSYCKSWIRFVVIKAGKENEECRPRYRIPDEAPQPAVNSEGQNIRIFSIHTVQEMIENKIITTFIIHNTKSRSNYRKPLLTIKIKNL